MTGTKLSHIRAWVFDAYGTLFDFNSAVTSCNAEIGHRADALSKLWREKQLQYTWLRSLMGMHQDFWHVTGEALRYAMSTLGVEDEKLWEKLMELYKRLDPFPEVLGTLKKLKTLRLKTAILSNGSPEMLAAAVNSSGIGDLLDAVLSIEEVGIYKPHPSVYALASSALSLEPKNICFVSANSWDAHGASVYGFKVVWCNRYGQKEEMLPGKPDAEVSSLGEIPDLISP